MKALFIQLWSWVTGTSVALYQFFAPIFADAVSKTLTDILPIALEVVAGLMDSTSSGKEKQKRAFKDIERIAIRNGIEASTNVINAAIELALLHLKSV